MFVLFSTLKSRNLLHEFIQYIEVRHHTHLDLLGPHAATVLTRCSLCFQSNKVVLLEDLASHFGMRTQDAISRLQDLLADGSLTGQLLARLDVSSHDVLPSVTNCSVSPRSDRRPREVHLHHPGGAGLRGPVHQTEGPGLHHGAGPGQQLPH